MATEARVKGARLRVPSDYLRTPMLRYAYVILPYNAYESVQLCYYYLLFSVCCLLFNI